jgi:hypothetical protein
MTILRNWQRPPVPKPTVRLRADSELTPQEQIALTFDERTRQYPQGDQLSQRERDWLRFFAYRWYRANSELRET